MLERERSSSNAVIKVIGVGGGGGNAINTMIESGLTGVEFIAANTDVQALQSNLASIKIQLGRELTKGLGAGANPDVGRDAALEDKAIIQEVLSGADMVFVTAGMGGGTGTGAAPIIAQVARELGALTVGVVTKPFSFEGKRRKNHCEGGIGNLQACVDTLITIPNQRLLSIAPPSMSMLDGFKLADEVLLNAVKGISDIINIPGRVNVDFADVRTIMSEMGMALMGIGTAVGPTRAADAARAAINSPLLEDVDIEGATGILINITGSSNLTLHEISEASTLIQEAVHEDANIIFGAVVDETMGENIRVTVIATGFDQARIAFSDPHSRNYGTNMGQGYTQPGAAPSAQFQPAQQSAPVPGRPQPGYNMNPAHTPYDSRTNPAQNAQVPRGTSLQGTGNHLSQPTHNTQYGQIPVRAPQEIGQQSFRGREPQTQAPNQYEGSDLQRRATTPQSFHPARMAQEMQAAQAQRAQGQGQGQSHDGAHLRQPQPQTHGHDAQNHGYEQPKMNKSEFEELTQWTLEMARTQGAPAQHTSGERHINGASTNHPDGTEESSTDKAFHLADELSDIEMDETDFETPAFLRRKDDSLKNI